MTNSPACRGAVSTYSIWLPGAIGARASKGGANHHNNNHLPNSTVEARVSSHTMITTTIMTTVVQQYSTEAAILHPLLLRMGMVRVGAAVITALRRLMTGISTLRLRLLLRRTSLMTLSRQGRTVAAIRGRGTRTRGGGGAGRRARRFSIVRRKR